MTTSYDYGLVAADVVAEVPGIDGGNIGASTEPVSTTDIGVWLNEGAARINALLDKSGITASASMDVDAHDSLAAAVKAYAVAKTLAVLGITGALYNDARDRWNTIWALYSNRPQDLGTAYDDGLTVNIDTDTKSDDWGFVNNERQNW